MPDWFYRTISRPLLFRLPAPLARDVALGFMGRLARLPGGPALIDFLGHMRPDPRLARSAWGLKFPSPVGLGPGIDCESMALEALARFGFGFLEVGPVSVVPIPSDTIKRVPEQQALWFANPPPHVGLTSLQDRLARFPGLSSRIIVRLGLQPGAARAKLHDEVRQIAELLTSRADLFSLGPVLTEDSDFWQENLPGLLAEISGLAGKPPLVCVAADLPPAQTIRIVEAVRLDGISGIIVDGAVRAEPEGRLLGPPARRAALAQVRHLRQRFGNELIVIASGGVHEPSQALDLIQAGANFIEIDSGLVYAGPGLPKRVNEALVHAGVLSAQSGHEPTRRPAEMTWFWTLLMGTGMFIGAVLALIIAATRVVLHYDEAFAGMTRAQLHGVNDRLLAFMAHDRVSLAGTMISIGVLYSGLSWGGIRRGLRWAQTAVLASAFAGFATFFLFLGFGYFDPFHAFVTAILFQFLLLGLHAHAAAPHETAAPNLREDRAWRWSQWGQLLFIVQGCALLGAGSIIGLIGVTHVFVHEDLEFMQTTAEVLTAANPRLVPLVAHDRATFGGMLVACGIVVLLSSLWGFRQGRRWLWWTLFASGAPAYVAAIGVHLAVGYTNLFHLAPAIIGFATLLGALVLSYPYFCRNAAVIGWHIWQAPGAGEAAREQEHAAVNEARPGD